MEKLLTLSVKCPHCDHSFMDEEHEVNGKPGIRFNIETSNDRGLIWLCPIYGCFKHDSTITIAEGEIVKFSCPHCNRLLTADDLCKSCKAPTVGFNINVGGKVHICSRSGCRDHFIVFDEAEDLMNLFYEKFEPRY